MGTSIFGQISDRRIDVLDVVDQSSIGMAQATLIGDLSSFTCASVMTFDASQICWPIDLTKSLYDSSLLKLVRRTGRNAWIHKIVEAG